VSHWSRACSERIIVRDPREDADAFVADLRAYLRQRPDALILPTADFSLHAISERRAELTDVACLPLPSQAAVTASLDRQALGRAAAAAGMAAVPTTLVNDLPTALEVATTTGQRMIVKSTTTTVQCGARVIAGARTRPMAGADELRQLADSEFPLLLQRAESGQTLSVGGVIGSGRLLACATSMYVRTWPPDAGNAVFSTTIATPAGLRARAERLLADLGWEGLFELEVIQRDDGQFAAIDLNPRPYGSMALAIAAGANLPAVWCDWVRGQHRGFVEARPGVWYRWTEADLRHVLMQSMRRGRVSALRSLRPRRHVVHPHVRATDPLPAVARAISLAQSRLRSR
jgi:predicted ATP-grasp superfamily ATP-dependent carboligase